MRRIEKNPPPTNTFLYPRAIILPDMKWGLPAQGRQLQTLSSLQNAFTLDCQSAIFSFFTVGKTAEREWSNVKVSRSAFHLVLPREKHEYNKKKKKKHSYLQLQLSRTLELDAAEYERPEQVS